MLRSGRSTIRFTATEMEELRALGIDASDVKSSDELDLVSGVLRPLFQRSDEQLQQDQLRHHGSDARVRNRVEHAISYPPVGGRSFKVVNPNRSIERNESVSSERRG